MGPLAGGGGNAMRFTYGAEPAGENGWSERHFAMPSADEFWIRLRLHMPANYHHRVDTYLEIANAYAAGWRVGYIVRGRDGTPRPPSRASPARSSICAARPNPTTTTSGSGSSPTSPAPPR